MILCYTIVGIVFAGVVILVISIATTAFVLHRHSLCCFRNSIYKVDNDAEAGKESKADKTKDATALDLVQISDPDAVPETATGEAEAQFMQPCPELGQEGISISTLSYNANELEDTVITILEDRVIQDLTLDPENEDETRPAVVLHDGQTEN